LNEFIVREDTTVGTVFGNVSASDRDIHPNNLLFYYIADTG